MAEAVFSAEFVLAAACCRRPLSEGAVAAIRAAAGPSLDWSEFMRLMQRHRIAGLGFDALTKSGVAVPPDVQAALSGQAQQIARQNILLTAETVRLQAAFAEAGIVALVLKGAPLAQLAYGSLAIKQGRDVDFVVPPDGAARAFALLEGFGYRLSMPATELTPAQRDVVVRYGNEAEFVHEHKPLRVDLHWQLAYNPALLEGVGARSPARSVDIPGFGSVRALETADHFAYLCVHGAYHRWSRLKWLADLNALLCAAETPAIPALYDHAKARGAGLCARQALLLARTIFDLRIPDGLSEDFRADPKADRLVRMSLRALRSDRSEELSLGGHFLLGEGAAYFLGQSRIVCIGLSDAIRFPLPAWLHFLYPVLRLPMMLWRRATR